MSIGCRTEHPRKALRDFGDERLAELHFDFVSGVTLWRGPFGCRDLLLGNALDVLVHPAERIQFRGPSV